MKSTKFKEKCLKHPQHEIDYMRINQEYEQDKSKSFFCCFQCLKKDGSINIKDYEEIKYLLQSTSQQILDEWPPNIQKEFIDKLIEIVNGESQNSSKTIQQQIIEFFDNLKKEINEQIDICQKKMIEIAEKLPKSTKEEREQEIGEKYQEITKIKDLKQILFNNDMKIEEKQRICQDLVSQCKSNSTKISLDNLLNQYTPQFIFDTQSAQIISKQIKDSINSIRLFIKNKDYQQQNNLNIQFIFSEYKKGQNKLAISINDHNQPEVMCRDEDNQWMKQIFSGLIFDSNLKYILRFKLKILNEGNSVYIGLIQDHKKNNDCGGSDHLFCQLTNYGEYISNYDQDTRFKKLKNEEEFKLEQESEIEFRVSISENILQILDFPHYQSTLSLDDQYISNLQKAEQLRLFVGLYHLNESVTLIHSEIVDQFEQY